MLPPHTNRSGVITLAEAVQALVLGGGRSFQFLDTQWLRALFQDDGDGAFTVKSHAMRSRHTANETLKQAGLTKEF